MQVLKCAENACDGELVNHGNKDLFVIQAGSKRHGAREENAQQQLYVFLLKHQEKSHKHQNNIQ